jgi:hypothetical protein
MVKVLYIFVGEPGTSVSIVSGYGLDDREIKVRSSAEAKGFFLLAFVSSTALRPTQPPVQWGTGGPFHGVKARPGRDADHSHPSSAEIGNE